MNETLKQIAERVADEMTSLPGMRQVFVGFSRRLVAELAKQQEPVAWFVRRNAPGKRDDGMRLGPFWKKEDAEDWVDDRHILHALYATPQPTPQEAWDAARYRWLKNYGCWLNPDKFAKAGRVLDDAIDAAMAAAQEGN